MHDRRTEVKGATVMSKDTETDSAADGGDKGGAAMMLRSASIFYALHPPVEQAFGYRPGQFLLLVSFAVTPADLTAGGDKAERVRLRAGALMMLEPGSGLRVYPREPAEMLVLGIEPALIAALSAAGTRPWRPRPVRDLLDPAIATLALEIRRSMLADPASSTDYLDMLARTLLVRVGCHMLDDLEEERGREALSPGKLSRIVQYIDARLHEAIAVETLAGMAGLSRSHFSRAFQRMTGDPPQRFILKRRVCRARDLLSGGDAPIAQIALKSGFSSQAHLSAAFRDDVGTTPSRYRAAFRGAGAGELMSDQGSGLPILSQGESKQV
jgi:AraC family transcriptional regulator